MLVRLFGRNFRSLRDKFELSLVAADLTRKEDCDRGVIEVPLDGSSEPLRLLRAVAIFGSNASGKSTVIAAGRALHRLGIHSSEKATSGDRIPSYAPFVLEDATKDAPIELGCDVVCGNSLLRYEIMYGENEIKREVLTSLREGGETNLIDRRFSGDITGRLIEASSANQLYVKEMLPNVTVLSKLAQHGPQKGEESVQLYYRAIRDATRDVDYSFATSGFDEDERFADDKDYREWIMRHLIRTADVGICDVRTHRERFDVPKFFEEFAKEHDIPKFPDKRVIVRFVHEGRSNQAISFSDESSGTKKLYHIADDWWTLSKKPVTLLVDELGASLHPRLLDRLIRSVNEAPPKRVRSQLVFTSHETALLESQDGHPPALRRDQVYFTKKSPDGASELYSLAEFKEDARPTHNIRKRYMSGLYGAIPSVEKLML